ncbi:MAG: putative ribosomally synthesized peptide with SipW-like signal peptide [Natronomonas sp.]|jgi:predicted ribosomally synthesized peptide with SipW-like signal peptide
MTDNNGNIELSRRKVLAGLGTIGLASAGAGLGTSAYFSDVETFSNNSLVAGSLDMKVDWEEHYSDWSDDESEFAYMPMGEEDPDYVLPPLNSNGELIPDAKPIELVFPGETAADKQAAKDSLWEATAIEAFPDVLVQDPAAEDYDGLQDVLEPEEAICDFPADLDAVLSHPFRTGATVDGGVTLGGQTTQADDPLIQISDVKPGDFGEVTFSFHLCDNPGYVWLNGELVSAAENGHTEPEAEDPDEFGASDSTNPEDVELLDEIVTRVWYDPNGNNQVDVLAGEIDLMLAIDDSGSIDGEEQDNLIAGVNSLVTELQGAVADIQTGLLTFGDDSIDNFLGLTDPSTLPTFSAGDFDFSGNTPLPAALDIADQELRNGANARGTADKVIVVITDGGPNYENIEYTAGGYTAPRGNPDTTGFSQDDTNNQYDGGGGPDASGQIIDSEEDETALVAETIRDSTTRIVTVNVAEDPNAAGDGLSVPFQQYLEDEIASSGFAYVVGLGDLSGVAEDIVALVTVPEEVFFQGTLREALTALAGNEGRGIPLDGDRTTAFDEVNGRENDPARDCFAGLGTTHYLGFQWWLPIDHANQIQTDSVEFDIGFYTEQCRHNDGGGMVPEETVRR